MKNVPTTEVISHSIFLVRGQRIMLDRDLAKMYGVEVRMLVQAVKRNIGRFPDDFMFHLKAEEWQTLRSQFVILDMGRGKYTKYMPYAFTEQGVAMLSSVLNSERAIQVNVAIMRAFVQMRGMLVAHKDLTRRIDDLERKYAGHDVQMKMIFAAIKQLVILTPPPPPRRIEGFVHKAKPAALKETRYLLSIPGMRESIRRGIRTPISKCSKVI